MQWNSWFSWSRNRKTRAPRRRTMPRLEALEGRDAPAVFTVTNPTDSAVSGQVNLRQAIASANTADDPDTIQFDPSLAGQTISLTQVGDGGAGPSALAITTPITILGSGVTLTRGGTTPFRLFLV